jgi:hypothetical protein
MEILVTLGIGAAGGIIVLVFEHLYLSIKERRAHARDRLISFPHNQRVLDDAIFTHLSHGASIELMKTTLGTPNKVGQYDSPVFATSRWGDKSDPETEKRAQAIEEGLGVATHTYLYNFKNADVKITSKDNVTVDSLTVISNDGSIRLGSLLFPWNEDESLKFGQIRVNEQMVEDCRAEFIQTRWDNQFVLSLYVGSPTYDFVTYFGYRDPEKAVDFNRDDPKSFVGGIIDGVCLSQDDADVYYIYFSELR